MKAYREKIKNSSYMQWFATFGVFLLLVQEGISVGWNSPNAVRLESEGSPIRLTSSEVSWVLSAITVSGMIGAIVGSISVECLGSRKSVLLSYIVAAISWGCLIIANSFELLFIGRILNGISIVMVFCCFSIYLGEVSEPEIRGTLICISLAGSAVGTAIGTIAETYLPMKLTSSIYLAVCIAGIVMFLWFKDTSYYLVRKGDLQSAESSIAFYKPGRSREKELSEVKNFVEDNYRQNIFAKLTEFKKPTVRKSVLLIVILFALSQTCGYMTIMSYMEIILESAKFDLIKPDECVIYLNIICAIVSILVINLVDVLGRRFSLILSSVGTILSLLCLGLHFHLITLGYDSKALQWLPIGSVVFFLVVYSIGFNTVPSTLQSEIFSENMKSIAVCIATFSMSLFAFATTKAYQPLVNIFGEAYTFWIFALITVLALPIVLYLLPETKGKTFQEIQDLLRGNL